MAFGRCHFVDELAVIREDEQAGRILIKSPHSLHALHRPFLRALAQGRGQQGVDAGPGRRLLRALGACRFVQHDVSLRMVLPRLALHGKGQAVVHGNIVAGIGHGLALQLHQTLLHQAGAHTAGAKALGVEQVGQAHGGWRAHHSTRTMVWGLKPKLASRPLRARAVRALFRLRISSVSSRALPPRPVPLMRTLRV